MAHFAKVCNGKVIRVIVAEQEFFETFKDDQPGEWIQTSYNTHSNVHTNGGTSLRGNFARIGDTYDREHDVFYATKPYPSWTLNHSTWTWNAPTSKPNDDKQYEWNESTQSWDEVEN